MAPKTVLDKVKAAIVALAEPSGSSRQKIAKYLASEFAYENKVAFNKCLKTAVSKGQLVQKGQSFLLAGQSFQEAPEEKTVVVDQKVGGGDVCESGDTVVVKYKGTLDDGSVFDSASSFTFTIGAGECIKGYDAVAGMAVGGKRKLTIPSKLGYGKRGSPPEIPPNATLTFVVELKSIK
eukprot:GFYU01012546.1.p1 GENE.GFYU01012546.1~~GFYU01012546.1.p1  ORF type:complete len:179 (-),score=48.73 GFYU01012546.1:75-611(-)